MKHLVSMREVSKDEIIKILEITGKIENKTIKPDLTGKVMAALFFEPSTRTRFSFESAMKKLNGEVISLAGAEGTSIEKGESLKDTVKVMERYADIIVIRHKLEGAARFISEVTNIPVVNAGDGANQHPTQALLDLYSIQKTQGKLENIKIAMVGDLRYGRTVHSLSHALINFNPTLFFVSPKSLTMSENVKFDLKEKGINFEERERIEDIISEVDILYMTRIQKERFPDLIEYERVKNIYVLTKEMLKDAKENLKVLHPLPRVNEIQEDVDSTKFAYYFEQAKNGIFVRQAIISILLGEA
jgi:aspartate carbamoyltransferase catalytic subunit